MARKRRKKRKFPGQISQRVDIPKTSRSLLSNQEIRQKAPAVDIPKTSRKFDKISKLSHNELNRRYIKAVKHTTSDTRQEALFKEPDRPIQLKLKFRV